MRVGKRCASTRQLELAPMAEDAPRGEGPAAGSWPDATRYQALGRATDAPAQEDVTARGTLGRDGIRGPVTSASVRSAHNPPGTVRGSAVTERRVGPSRGRFLTALRLWLPPPRTVSADGDVGLLQADVRLLAQVITEAEVPPR